MNQEFRFSHRIKKPFEYVSAANTDIRATFAKHRLLHPTKAEPKVLQYPSLKFTNFIRKPSASE